MQEVAVSSTDFTDESVHPQGWPAHELALFGRAALSLSSESLCIEIDYGLTDDGEPWLVLCDEFDVEEGLASGCTALVKQNVHPRGWSTHEFALFCRAATLLSSESRCVEIDHGLTDEGEPWLVLCDADSGDVFGHFAKLNEQYIACVPFYQCSLTAWELPGLLSRFLQRGGVAWSSVTRAAIRQP